MLDVFEKIAQFIESLFKEFREKEKGRSVTFTYVADVVCKDGKLFVDKVKITVMDGLIVDIAPTEDLTCV